MPDVSILAGGVLLGVVVGLVLYLTFGRSEGAVTFASAREKRLTHQLAGQLGCSPAVAVGFVRRELECDPAQPDATILKRAAYHYTRNLPEPGLGCYRDRRPG
jgi:hypothetical protein